MRNRSSWFETFVILGLLYVTLFIIMMLLGLFVDPAMTEPTREGVVVFFGMSATMATIAVISVRHSQP